MENYPKQAGGLFLDGGGTVKTEPEKRLRLHRMAYAWVWLYRMGTDMFGEVSLLYPGISHIVPGKYLTAGEVKRALPKGSFGFQVLWQSDPTGTGMVYISYAGSADEMVGENRMDLLDAGSPIFIRKRGRTTGCRQIFLADGMELLPLLLEGDRGIKNQLFSLDDTYEKVCLLPTIPEGSFAIPVAV